MLRSWESEFPDLGVSRGAGPRTYRRADVEKVLRIRQLVFSDGLTLAGVRRRIEDEAPPVIEEEAAAPIKELLGRNAKERLSEVKRGLIGLLELLSGRPGDPHMAVRAAARAVAVRPAVPKRKSKPARTASRKPSRRRR